MPTTIISGYFSLIARYIIVKRSSKTSVIKSSLPMPIYFRLKASDDRIRHVSCPIWFSLHHRSPILSGRGYPECKHHLAHRDTALLTASQIAMTSGILTRYTCRQHRKRFRTYIFAELEVFIITQSHALMISPKVTGRFTGFQRSDGVFPLIDVLQTVSMSTQPPGKRTKRGCISASVCARSGRKPFFLPLNVFCGKREIISSSISPADCG